MSILPPSFRSLRTQRLARIAATALCGALLAACATTPVTEPQDAGAAATIAPAPEPVYRPFPEEDRKSVV